MIPFIHIWLLTIPSYGLMVATGMVVAYFILRADIARRALSDDPAALAEKLIALPCLAGIVVSRIYAIVEAPGDFLADPWGQIFTQYGFTWTGGLLGGLIVLIWLARRNKLSILLVLDLASPASALGYGFGRMGCLLAGDGDYGTPTSLPWGMSFPHGLVPTTERVHPTPVYEFIGACVIAWVLWRMGRSFIGAPAVPPKSGKVKGAAVDSKLAGRAGPTAHIGDVFAAYLVLTGVARFLVEFIRINPRTLFGLTTAQVSSAIGVVVGVALWWHARRTQRHA
jgi:phosphatidylglycerol:prolipoprotein diacylglycerol transferase